MSELDFPPEGLFVGERVASEAVLHVMVAHDLGTPPGPFLRDLILLLCHADEDNFRRLTRGFPDVATAVSLYKNVPDGIEILKERARGE